MKTGIIFLLTLFVFTMSITLIASDVKVQAVTFKCKEISCTGCKAHITEALKDMNGVKKIDVNIKEKTVYVEFDDSLTTLEKIKEAIEETGYSAEVIS